MRIQYDVDMIMNRRKSPHSNDFLGITNNNQIPAQQFVRIYEEPNDNTIESRKAWGIKMANYCTEVGNSDKFMYKTKFVYCGDDTGDSFEPIANHFQDQDVIYLIKHMFPTAKLSDMANDTDFLHDFFDKSLHDHGTKLLNHASRLTSEFGNDIY